MIFTKILQGILEQDWIMNFTSNYQLDRPLPKGKNEKVIGLIKDELGKKVMTKFVGLKRKTYGWQ